MNKFFQNKFVSFFIALVFSSLFQCLYIIFCYLPSLFCGIIYPRGAHILSDNVFSIRIIDLLFVGLCLLVAVGFIYKKRISVSIGLLVPVILMVALLITVAIESYKNSINSILHQEQLKINEIAFDGEQWKKLQRGYSDSGADSLYGMARSIIDKKLLINLDTNAVFQKLGENSWNADGRLSYYLSGFNTLNVQFEEGRVVDTYIYFCE